MPKNETPVIDPALSDAIAASLTLHDLMIYVIQDGDSYPEAVAGRRLHGLAVLADAVAERFKPYLP